MKTNRVVIKDGNGVVSITSLSNLKSGTKGSSSPTIKKRSGVNKNNFHTNPEINGIDTLNPQDPTPSYTSDVLHHPEMDITDFVALTNLENPIGSNTTNILPYPDRKNLLLSGCIDDPQVYVVKDDNNLSLVMIKKVQFLDGEKYTAGCSTCYNINSNFLLYIDSPMYMKNESSKLIKCKHIASTLACILETFGQWKPSIHEEEIQIFLEHHCTWTNSDVFFLNENHPTYCGAIDQMDGLILFVLKKDRWRCVTDKLQLASKCRHGQYIEYNIEYHPRPSNNVEVKLSPFPIMEKQMFSSKYKTILFF